MLHALDAPEFAALLREEAPEATVEQLIRVHPARYRRGHPGDPARGSASTVQLDADTAMSEGSAEAALRAAGAGVHGGRCGDGGLGAQRPSPPSARPGITPNRRAPWAFACSTTPASRPMHARARMGLQRVAVVDFDVHHGNGTQALFAQTPELFYGSSHQ